MAEIVVFADVVAARRRQASRRIHARCVEILWSAVEAARCEVSISPPHERWVRIARLRKLEELHGYAGAIAC